ncbi:MAG: hypothetical protein USCGTAYLOR_00265 [Chromatiales bacterium USCg_Taylor]|nr:MAG: hypothetical protein USCGTAYLOR_00265 [Chromatiales bacterium USCg_Taylor]
MHGIRRRRRGFFRTLAGLEGYHGARRELS